MATVNEKMTALADILREKSGKTGKMGLDAMIAEARKLGSGAEEAIRHADIPEYVKEEALRVANLVQAARKDDSIVFLAMADSHHCGTQDNTSWQAYTNIGNLHAGMAAKVLAYALDMDFVCHLGDLTFGHDTTTSSMLHQQLDEMCSYLDESQKGIPAFWTVGNHDTGMYAVNSGTETKLETADYLFSIFGNRCEGAVYGSMEYGYCYRDFADKKLRVICLNSSELDTVTGYGTAPSLSQTQLKWFADTLYEVGGNEGWSVVVLSHYPLDFYNAYPASDVVKAYVEGGSITVNGTAVNFSGHNKAKFVANFHGHTHCFKYARLNQVNPSASSASEYDAWRVAVPNSAFYRNNHQAETDKHGISFKDDQTWDKTIGGAKDTAFVINVVTPTEEVIQSFTYGAGPEERIIGYGDVVYHKITRSISNATINNTATSVKANDGYAAVITPNEHCTITSVTVTMGGTDITSTAYTDGRISIQSVTGDVVITVKAALALACTNQIPISTTSSGAVYNKTGYKTGVYVHKGADSPLSGVCSTGFIPIKHGDVIRMKDMDFIRGIEKHRIACFDSSYNFINNVQGHSTYLLDTTLKGVMDSGNRYVQFTMNTTHDTTKNAAFIRVSCANITDASILTVNEEIKYIDDVANSVAIINTLTYATNSNKAASVTKGSSYTANITAISGYALQSVTVTMGGTNITETAYSNGTISIASVTGDLVITAVAVSDGTASYVNQIPISTDASGAVYNGIGYKEDTYLSSGNDGTKSGIFATGFIPCKIGDTLHCRNIGMQTGQDAHRLCFYDSSKTCLNTLKTSSTGYTGWHYGTDGNIETLDIKTSGSNSTTAYVRICCGYIGDDSVITVNEEIV